MMELIKAVADLRYALERVGARTDDMTINVSGEAYEAIRTALLENHIMMRAVLQYPEEIRLIGIEFKKRK